MCNCVRDFWGRTAIFWVFFGQQWVQTRSGFLAAIKLTDKSRYPTNGYPDMQTLWMTLYMSLTRPPKRCGWMQHNDKRLLAVSLSSLVLVICMMLALASVAGCKNLGFYEIFLGFGGFGVLMWEDQTQHLTNKLTEGTTWLELKYGETRYDSNCWVLTSWVFIYDNVIEKTRNKT